MHKELKDAIKKTINAAKSDNDSIEIDFHWNGNAKTRCLSGLTRGGLGWETDDVEADNRKQAELDAAEYLNMSSIDPFDGLEW